MNLTKLSLSALSFAGLISTHAALAATSTWAPIEITNNNNGGGNFEIITENGATSTTIQYSFNSSLNTGLSVIGAYYDANWVPNSPENVASAFLSSGLVNQSVYNSLSFNNAAVGSINNTGTSSTASISDRSGFNYLAIKPGQGQLVFALNPAVTTFNLTKYSGTGEFSNIKAYTGDIITAPVPEPETYLMLLAGLGVVGYIARRRQNSISAPSFC